MPRGHERILVYLREREGEGRAVLRAAEAPPPPPGQPPCRKEDRR